VTIDDLEYNYGNANSNKITSITEKVTDPVYKPRGFNPGATSGTAAYTYDANGNLLNDPYKGCAFTYNYLNLPDKITWNSTKYIELVYTATGKKLRKIVTNGSLKTVIDYLDEVELKDGVLDAVYHSEGRVKSTGDIFRYEYALKDHLGNSRVFYTDVTKDGYIDKSDIIQEDHYYAFGMPYDQYPWGNNSNPNRYQFNGKELNSDLGLNLMDYGARWYDAAIGRWTSVDPLAGKYHSWSPFNYVMDNPIKFIDIKGDSVSPIFSSPSFYPNGSNSLAGHVAINVDGLVYSFEGDGKWVTKPYYD
jgi:RHS repeat-associated protein